MVDLYEAEGCFVQRGLRQGEPMKARTKTYTVARLRHHVVPLLGHKRVTDVGPGEIERFVRDVAVGKTARDEKTAPGREYRSRRGGGCAQSRARSLRGSQLCSETRFGQSNPCELAAVRKTDNRRDRFLTLKRLPAWESV